MGKIVIQKDFAYIYFLSEFYDKSNIMTVAELYDEFLFFELSVFGKYNVAKIKVKDISLGYSLEELSKEFSNYVLGNQFSK